MIPRSGLRHTMASAPKRRLAQVHRHLHATPRPRRELRDAYILGAARTPTGKFNGALASVPAPQLAATAIRAALARSGVPAASVTATFVGNVMSASIGQAPARQAALLAGLPATADATTVNKVCASGLRAVALGAQSVQLGVDDAVVAGGMESMSRVPYYLPRGPALPPLGAVTLEDGLIKDGLTDAYDQIHMGVCAEQTAKKHGIGREEQDTYAVRSFKRAQAAWAADKFADEIAPVTVKDKKGEHTVERDEGYDSLREDKVPTLKPAFVKDGGTVTAANSSTLNDGASALVLGSEAMAKQYASKSRVLARVVSSADAAVDPVDFPIAPAKAVPLALERAGITQSDVAVWEFNEAFAAVIKANEKVCRPNMIRISLLRKRCVDPRLAESQRQPAGRRHLARPCLGQLRISYPRHATPPAEARGVWRCRDLQRRRWRDCSRGTEARKHMTHIVCPTSLYLSPGRASPPSWPCLSATRSRQSLPPP